MFVSSGRNPSQSLSSRFPKPFGDSLSGSPPGVNGFPDGFSVSMRRRVQVTTECTKSGRRSNFLAISHSGSNSRLNTDGMMSPRGSISTPSSRQGSPYDDIKGSRSTTASPNSDHSKPEGPKKTFWGSLAGIIKGGEDLIFFSSDDSDSQDIRRLEEHLKSLEEKEGSRPTEDKKTL